MKRPIAGPRLTANASFDLILILANPTWTYPNDRQMRDGAWHHQRCRQKLADHGPVPLLRPPRLESSAIQGAEHEQQRKGGCPHACRCACCARPCRPRLARRFLSVACPSLLKQAWSRRLQPLGGQHRLWTAQRCGLATRWRNRQRAILPVPRGPHQSRCAHEPAAAQARARHPQPGGVDGAGGRSLVQNGVARPQRQRLAGDRPGAR